VTTETLTPTPFLVGGFPEVGRHAVAVRSPFDGRLVGEVALAEAPDVRRSIDAAAQGLSRGLPTHQRAEILDEAAALLGQRRSVLASLVSSEVGKPITLALAEVDRAVSTLRFSAAVARTHSGQGIVIDAASAGAGKVAFTKLLPVGIVGAITPFNFPLNLVAHKLAPAIAAGCPVVLKPAPQAPLTALALAGILLEAGLPGDFLSVVPGSPAEVGEILIEDQRVAAITFTGSTAVGWMLRERAPRKKVLLELGNSAPAIVHKDADLGVAAAKLVSGAFAFAGQSCVSVQRVFVHRDVSEELSELMVTKAAALGIGDPSNPEVTVGPVIDTPARVRILDSVQQAVDGGAQLVTGGDHDGNVVVPTIVAEVPSHSSLARQEVFGPVFGLNVYSDVADAFVRANDTSFALQASIFTSDLRLALDATDTLDFGAVLVNEAPAFRTDGMPYGGGQDSGNTREGPASTVRELTEERLVILDQASTPSRS
jgi:acyl-CoA reductase-like NAD-dependent aldehyde dehydrogenase